MDKRLLLIPLISIILLGAGCVPQTTAPLTTPSPDTQNNQAKPDLLTPAITDDTWQTYTNAVLAFSFQTPTKGLNAPQWEVKIFREDAPEVVNGYVAEGARMNPSRLGVTLSGQEFSISQGTEGAAGSVYFNDAYSTHIGKFVVVVIFTKKAFMADIGNCVRAPGQNFWSEFAKPGSCIPFSDEEYQKTLDGIMGTFKTE